MNFDLCDNCCVECFFCFVWIVSFLPANLTEQNIAVWQKKKKKKKMKETKSKAMNRNIHDFTQNLLSSSSEMKEKILQFVTKNTKMFWVYVFKIKMKIHHVKLYPRVKHFYKLLKSIHSIFFLYIFSLSLFLIIHFNGIYTYTYGNSVFVYEILRNSLLFVCKFEIFYVNLNFFTVLFRFEQKCSKEFILFSFFLVIFWN